MPKSATSIMDDPCQLQLMVEKKWMLFLDMPDTLNFRFNEVPGATGS